MEFFKTLGELFIGYFTHGFPFFLAHIVVVLFIYKSWSSTSREAGSLRQWNPSQANEGSLNKSETTEILDRFVQESEKLGPYGFFVPMTDFSDRLDSIIDGMLAELHDRTNFLLLVGIAGTLFGVFEFAFRAYEVIQAEGIEAGQRVLKMGEFLSASMSKAFPVGFVGLFGTLIAQIFAAFPERSLRKALANATSKALRHRQEVSQSQAHLVEQSVDRIEGAMEPLRDLQQTLSESVQPVVREFGERLDQSLELVKTQFEQLHRATEGVHASVAALNEGVASLTAAAKNQEDILRDAPHVLENLAHLQEQQQVSLKEFDKSLREQVEQGQQAIEALWDTALGLSQLPEEILSETRHALSEVVDSSLSTWQNVLIEFQDKSHTAYSNLLDDIRQRTNEIIIPLTTASVQWKQVAQSMQGLPDKMLANIDDTFARLSKESLSTWREASEEFAQGVERECSSYLTNIGSHANQIKESLQEAVEEWSRLVQSTELLLREPIQQTIQAAREELSNALKNLDQALAHRYPQVIDDIKMFTEELKNLLTGVMEGQSTLDSWLEAAQKAHSTIEETNQALKDAVKEIQQARPPVDSSKIVATLVNDVKQLAVTNKLLLQIEARMRPSTDGINTQLQNSIKLLDEIRKGIDKLPKEKVKFWHFRK